VPILDTIRTAVGPVLESAEGVERQADDVPGGGAIDETAVFSPSLFVQSLSFGTISEDAATDAGFPVETTVHELGSGLTSGTGAADDALQDFQDGLEGSGDGAASALGRVLSFVTQNPMLVAGGLLLLYLVPLLTNLTGVAAGVADGG